MTPLGWILLLVVLAAVGAGLFVARRRGEAPAAAPPPALPERDDLSTLGLSEVRARPAAPAPPVEETARFVDDPRLAAERPARPEPAREPSGGRPAWGDDAEVWTEAPIRYLLRSMAAHVGGAVAVVRHDGEQFRVAARTDGGPLASVRGTALGLTGPTPLIRADLGGLAALVGGEAMAVPMGPYVVLVGGRQDVAPGYLRLLAALAGTPAPGLPEPAARKGASPKGASSKGASPKGAPKAAATPSPEDAPPEAAEPKAPRAQPAEPGAPVPRATIIADEQAAARAAGRPLAFALVTLADAEERLTRGTAKAVARAEADLRDRLDAAPDVRRVEPFGDLLFGVFLDLEPGPAATWCDRLASGAPPLFIGAVAPADGDPTGIRDAAAEALHDAYDQQRARVVEV